MHILSFGAGAIGTYIGGSLALQGHRLTFIERPAAAEVLRQNGLRLHLPDGDHRLPVAAGERISVASSLEEALQSSSYDVALFALKSFDTPTAIAEMVSFANRMPAVLCLQNGVDNEVLLSQVIGADRVLHATVTSAIGRNGVGDIRLERLRGMGLTANHSLSARLQSALNQAGLNALTYTDPLAMKWSKLLTNLLANATSAITGLTPAQVFEHPGLYRMELAQLREALDVMKRLGLPVVDLPRTPVRLLAFAVRYLPAALAQPFMARAIGGGRGAKMPSFHIDLHQGRGQSEVDALNGAVVRAAVKAGTTAPVNALLTETLLALTNKELPLEMFQGKPQALLDRLTV